MLSMNALSARAAALLAAAGLALPGSSALGQAASAPAPALVCSSQPTLEAQAGMTAIMVEPHRFSSVMDLVKVLPPGAMAKFGAMQAAEEERKKTDWPNLCRYAAENARVVASGAHPKVIFLGDSITENWKLGDPSMFSSTVLDRGIGGQTTPQILLRFYQDVVALHPHVVHILAGANDIMGNTGPTTDEAIVNNIRAMIDIAKANHIGVVLSAITPSKTFIARPDFDMVPRIAAVNRQLAQLAKDEKVIFVDYTSVLTDQQGGLKDALGNDGLHPNRDGYAAMRPVTEKAIAQAVR